MYFRHLVKSDLASVCYLTPKHRTSHFLQGTRNIWPCVTGHPVGKLIQDALGISYICRKILHAVYKYMPTVPTARFVKDIYCSKLGVHKFGVKLFLVSKWLALVNSQQIITLINQITNNYIFRNTDQYDRCRSVFE